MHEAWEEEKRRLAPLPILPEPFDVTVRRPVHKDCMVHFEQRQYAVPFAWVAGRWKCGAARARCRSWPTELCCVSTRGTRPGAS